MLYHARKNKIPMQVNPNLQKSYEQNKNLVFFKFKYLEWTFNNRIIRLGCIRIIHSNE